MKKTSFTFSYRSIFGTIPCKIPKQMFTCLLILMVSFSFLGLQVNAQTAECPGGAQAAAEAYAEGLALQVACAGATVMSTSSTLVGAPAGACGGTSTFDVNVNFMCPNGNAQVFTRLGVVVTVTGDVTADEVPAGVDAGSVACGADAVAGTPPAAITDACGNTVNPTGPVASADPACTGTKTFTWTYTYCTGTTGTFVRTYTVTGDLTANEVPASTGSTVACLANATAPAPPAAITDACGNTVTPTGPVAGADPTCPGDGTKTYTWTYDYCNGTTTGDYVYTYTIDDMTAPVLAGACPATDQNVSVDPTTCTADFPAQIIPVSDNCGGPAPTVNPSLTGPMVIDGDGGCARPGQAVGAAQTVTYTATDCAGNTSGTLCTVTFTPIDSRPPVISGATAVDVKIPFDAMNCTSGGITVDAAFLLANGVMVSDACAKAANSITLNVPGGLTYDCSDIGTSVKIELTATDCNGNQGGEKIIWSEDFDGYGANQDIQNVGGWKAWGNDPNATAFTSTSFSRSGSNAVESAGTSDHVQGFSGINGGSWTVTSWQYIPANFAGQAYFIMLNQYDDALANLFWSTQVRFDGNTNQVVSEFDGATLPLIKGQWVELRVEIDLDNEQQTFFYNGQQLYQKSWTDGVSVNGILNLAAIDLFANSSNVLCLVSNIKLFG